MGYNPYEAVNAIYRLKGEWTEADKNGDTQKKASAANAALEYYDKLRKNGYGDIADKLSKSDYASSKAINDLYGKMGRTATRPYFYSLGKSYGMSEADVDKLLGYDNTTGEVTFGGKNIGKPDAVVDGTSYWSDTGKLDNAFSDYITRSGTARNTSSLVSQENEQLFKKYSGMLDDLKNTNPFETAEGKAILAKYDLSALQGRDNAVANGGAANGGNIDSFAAANATRQQAALVAQGQDAVLAAHQQKINNAMSILENMGVHIDRVYEQGETTKNNDLTRAVETSKVTGTVPASMSYASNPYFNADGTLADAFNSTEFDANGGFQRIIDDATEKLKTVTNAAERANLEATIKYANAAREYKIKNSPAHAKWAHTLSSYAPEATAEVKLADKEIDLEKYGIDKDAETSKYTTDANVQMNNNTNATNVAITNANNASNERISKDANATELEISKNANDLNRELAGIPSGEPLVSEEKVSEWVEDLNAIVQLEKSDTNYSALTRTGKNVYKVSPESLDWVIEKVYEDDTLSEEQKEYLLYNKFGISEDEVYKVLKDAYFTEQ